MFSLKLILIMLCALNENTAITVSCVDYFLVWRTVGGHSTTTVQKSMNMLSQSEE